MEKRKKWNNILEIEGLSNWKIKYSNSANLCIKETKTIIIHHISMAMFLHEVAHALMSKELDEKMGDRTGHHSIWADKYTELVEKYLEAIKNNK